MVKWPSVAVTSAHVRGQPKCAGLVWPAGLVPISLCSNQSVLKAIKGCWCCCAGLHMMTGDKKTANIDPESRVQRQNEWLKKKKHNPRIITLTSQTQKKQPSLWCSIIYCSTCIQMLQTGVLDIFSAGRRQGNAPRSPNGTAGLKVGAFWCRGRMRTTKTAKWLISHLSVKQYSFLLFFDLVMLVLNMSDYFYSFMTYFQDNIFCFMWL